ncbi:MAG: ArnT family glycosyltransferase [Vicinamibacterales bacterium]
MILTTHAPADSVTATAAALAVVGAVTVAATLSFWWLTGIGARVETGGDYEAVYEPVARAILTQGRPLTPDGAPATRYPPGYPLVLAAGFWASAHTGIDEATIRAGLALAAMAGSSMFLFLMARTIWPRQASFVAPALWTSCPLVLWMSGIESSEPTFFVLFFAACYAAWIGVVRRRPTVWLAVAGVLLGAAMMVRPVAIAVGALLAAGVWADWRRDRPARVRLAGVALVLIGNLLVVAPWIGWLHQRTGRFVPLSDGAAPSMRDGLTFAINLKGYRAGTPVPSGVAAAMRDIQADYHDLRSPADVGRAVWGQLQERPVAVGELFLLKAARSWYGTDSHQREGAVAAILLVYLVPVIVGTFVAWQAGADARRLAVGIAAIVLYFWAMTVLVLSIVRYMLPALGLLFVLAPGAVVASGQRFRPAAAGG